MKNNNNILLIGGNGFMGKNIVHYMQGKGLDPAIYDLYVEETNDKTYQGNILNDDNLLNIISKYDTIIYLITSVSPKKSMDDPQLAYMQDIPMLIKTLECCVKANTKRVIFASSGGTVYGESNGKPNKESTEEHPINHYAVCKLACEKILQLYNKLYGMENIILRISNPYGLGQKSSSGVGAVTTFAEKMINNEEITIFGDGTISRDFIHIDAVCDAFYRACFWNFNKSITPVFNIGSGSGLTLNMIIDIISKTLNITPNIQYLKNRSFDVKYNVLDITKAKEYLGYNPGNDEVLFISEYAKQLNKKKMRR